MYPLSLMLLFLKPLLFKCGRRHLAFNPRADLLYLLWRDLPNVPIQLTIFCVLELLIASVVRGHLSPCTRKSEFLDLPPEPSG